MTGEPGPARDRIGEEERRSALAGVVEGRVFDLGTELSAGMPRGPQETFPGFSLAPYRTPRGLVEQADPPPFDFSMETVSGPVHLGSHIDAFSHIASRGRHFGGVRIVESWHDFGWRRHGAETIPPIIGRGVLIDAAGCAGGEQLPDGFELTSEHLAACLARQGTSLASGDVVLVRTGKFRDYHGDGSRYFYGQPGVGLEAARWLLDRGMAVLGTDTTATEPQPVVDEAATVHAAMLVDAGVHLLEILDLEELAAARAYSFLFLCLPLRIRGATGSWVRPVAIV
jgi:kynurenine formamidase